MRTSSSSSLAFASQKLVCKESLYFSSYIMGTPRLFFGFVGASEEEFRLSDKEIIHQVKNVLRLKKGERITLFNGTGKELLAEIVDFENGFLLLKRLAVKENIQEPKTEGILYCSILKKENFELAI